MSAGFFQLQKLNDSPPPEGCAPGQPFPKLAQQRQDHRAFLSRPSPAASSNAIGIDPADVLPYFSRLLKTLLRGIFKTSIAALMIRIFAWWAT